MAFLYEAALNVFLLSGGLGRLITSGDPDALLVSYRSGWSLWPGYVEARDLRIRSKDNNIEFDLRIDRCAFRCSLVDLLRRRFRVEWVRGDGVRFLSRMRIPQSEAKPRTVEALPPIEGLEAVPIKGPETPPPDNAHYNLWTVELDRVDARGVREVWLDTLRFVGDADAYGGFYLRPTRWASVGPATAIVRSGAIRSGADVIGEQLHGRLRVTVDGFDPRATHGSAVLHQASAELAMAARVPSLVFLRRWVDVDVKGGEGRAQIDLRMDHGRLTAGADVSLEARGVLVSSKSVTAVADVDLSATTVAEGGHDVLQALGLIRAAHVAAVGLDAAPISAERAEVRVRSADLDLVDRPFADATVVARAPAVKIADARIVDAWLGKGSSVGVRAGAGTLAASFEMARGVARGAATLAVDGLRADLGHEEAVDGALRAHLDLRRWDVASGAADISGSSLELREVRATGGTEGWWANLELGSGALALHAPTSFRSNVIVQARDTRPFVSALFNAEHVPSWLVPVVTGDDLRLKAELHVAPERLDVHDLAATAGALHLDGTFTKRGQRSRALALVGSGALNVALDTGGGGLALQLIDPGSWYRDRARAEEAADGRP